jgi:hypothetical protein
MIFSLWIPHVNYIRQTLILITATQADQQTALFRIARSVDGGGFLGTGTSWT